MRTYARVNDCGCQETWVGLDDTGSPPYSYILQPCAEHAVQHAEFLEMLTKRKKENI